ncbi:MAG: methylated-DNA--[protein]-cysteine S-methyltransferase [Rikenellaceae bacterium]
MTPNYFTYHSPIGLYRIEYTHNTITRIEIVSEESSNDGEQNSFTEEVSRQITEYFNGERRQFNIAIDYSNSTPFQAKVYKELLKIPYAEKRTYKEIATAINTPQASRAVGNANNRNPIQLIIPCHRVIGSNGSLTGYAGGVAAKDFLLNLESRVSVAKGHKTNL